VLLNPDVVLGPEFVGRLASAIENEPAFGSASGKVYRLPAGERGIIDTTGHVIYKNRLFTDRGEDEPDRGQFDEPGEIFGACAGVGLYKKAMLEDIREGEEYFDESFFLFLEDTDLNWRAQLRGWKCLYVPGATAWHHRGGTAKRLTRLVETHNYKNRYMMLIKNDSFGGFLKNLHHFIVTDTLKTTALLWRCPSALLGWRDVWRELPALYRKRRIIQKNRRVSQAEFEQWFVRFDYGQWVRRHIRGS
jgi:GT2 family glycosyltransferase